MKIKLALVAIALSSMFGAANAANVVHNFGIGLNPVGYEETVDNLIAGSFLDTYSFSIDQSSTTSAAGSYSRQKIGGKTVFNISDFSVNLFREAGAVDVLLNGVSGNNFVEMESNGLIAGDYYYTVGGTVSGTNSGSYNFRVDTIAAVPEPETYAMMLAGLGLLGFAARRKAKAA